MVSLEASRHCLCSQYDRSNRVMVSLEASRHCLCSQYDRSSRVMVSLEASRHCLCSQYDRSNRVVSLGEAGIALIYYFTRSLFSICFRVKVVNIGEIESVLNPSPRSFSKML